MIKKAFWTILLLGAIGGSTYQMATIIIEFYTYEVSVSKTFTYQRQATFPAITFCNMNPVKRSAVTSNPRFASLTSQTQTSSRRRRSESKEQLTQIDEKEANTAIQKLGVDSESQARQKRGNFSELLYAAVFVFFIPPSTVFARHWNWNAFRF